jgi:hypothetical protein
MKQAMICQDNEQGWEAVCLEINDYICQEAETMNEAIRYAMGKGFNIVNLLSAEELRIGNIVYHWKDGGEVAEMLTKQDFENDNVDVSFGIQLSRYWIENLGYKLKKENKVTNDCIALLYEIEGKSRVMIQYTLNKNVSYYFQYSTEALSPMLFYVNIKEIKFVHQLQNLHLDFTGEFIGWKNRPLFD